MASPVVQTYLLFEGNCEEALEFYKTAVGARVSEMYRFKDSPEPLPPEMAPPGSANKIMHATLHIGETTLMASDGRSPNSGFRGFYLCLIAENEAEAKKHFDALSAGGKVEMPLGKTFFSPYFGALTDKYDVGWMINVKG